MTMLSEGPLSFKARQITHLTDDWRSRLGLLPQRIDKQLGRMLKSMFGQHCRDVQLDQATSGYFMYHRAAEAISTERHKRPQICGIGVSCQYEWND